MDGAGVQDTRDALDGQELPNERVEHIAADGDIAQDGDADGDGGGTLLPGTRRALLHRVAVGQAQGRTPSLIGAVVRDGRLVWSGSRSMIEGHAPDTDTQYRIGSLTKTFTA